MDTSTTLGAFHGDITIDPQFSPQSHQKHHPFGRNIKRLRDFDNEEQQRLQS